MNELTKLEAGLLREGKRWVVMIWNGEGWTMHKPAYEGDARLHYERQVRVMPNCPAKLVKMTVEEEHVPG